MKFPSSIEQDFIGIHNSRKHSMEETFSHVSLGQAYEICLLLWATQQWG